VRGFAGARMRASLVIVVALSVCLPGEATGQSVMPHASMALAPGARMRVTLPGTEPFVGTLLLATNDSVRIDLASGSAITLPTSRLTRLELSAGVQRHGWKGAGIGLLSGAAVGGVIGFATYRRSSCVPNALAQIFCDLIDRTSREVTVAGDAALAGTAGALVGALIGRVGHETWIPVSVARVSSVRVRLLDDVAPATARGVSPRRIALVLAGRF